MSYSTTAFMNDPRTASQPGILYVVVLVNKKTHERECIKIGITKGNTWKDALRRSKGFKGYELRIQRVVNGTLEEVYHLEQYLHEKFIDQKYEPKVDFGGKTECFNIGILKPVLRYLKENYG